MQISKSVLGFQAQLYTENKVRQYMIMIYFSIYYVVIFVTLANLTEQA